MFIFWLLALKLPIKKATRGECLYFKYTPKLTDDFVVHYAEGRTKEETKC